jgi:YegS/Rv2252/BmrU family lipid kinase
MQAPEKIRTKAASLVAINRQARNAGANLDRVLDLLAGGGGIEVIDIEEGADLVPRLRAALNGDGCSSNSESERDSDGEEGNTDGNRGRESDTAFGRVIVGGGDGTVGSTLPLLLEKRVPLGILPLGTANDLARTLGLPADPIAAAEVIAAGHTRRIDVASVNDIPFLNAAGVGFSTALHRALAPRTKRVLGPLAYPLGVLKHWRSHRAFTVEVEIEGIVRRHRAIQVTVANGRFYGGGATAHEGAAIDDGLLDVVVIQPRPLPRFVLELPRMRRGRYEAAPAVTYRAAELSLRTRHRQAVSTDGEESTRTPARFRVHRHALEVFVPGDARTDSAR